MVILMQPNLQAAIDFYSDLGIKLIFHIKERWAEMRLGDVKIGLCPTQQVIDNVRTGIVLEVADLKKVYQELKDRVSFLSEPKEAVHGIMVSFKDPGGNLLDLYQPTPEKVSDLVKKTAESSKSDDGCGSTGSCCKMQTNDIACC
jgi:catechol 2,3-dioxygenase-like lactoylglutathione lyase family enzyme